MEQIKPKIEVDKVYRIIEDVFDEAVKKRWQKATIQRALVYHISAEVAAKIYEDVEFENEDS